MMRRSSSSIAYVGIYHLISLDRWKIPPKSRRMTAIFARTRLAPIRYQAGERRRGWFRWRRQSATNGRIWLDRSRRSTPQLESNGRNGKSRAKPTQNGLKIGGAHV